jgi:hypothetical protein
MMTRLESGGGVYPFASLTPGPDANGVSSVRPRFDEGHAGASPACVELAQTASKFFPAGGRDAEADHRIALHECCHATTGRLLGQPIGGVTIVERDGFAGRCWGPTFQSRLMPGPPVPSLCERIGSLMPQAGENHVDISEIVLHCPNRVVELCAGSIGEELFPLGPAWDAASDRMQERALASLVASSPDSIEAFVQFARIEAAHLLRNHEHVVHALTSELLVCRTMSGEEIDETIARAVAAKAVADEHRRRVEWVRVEESARAFFADQ